MNATMSEQPLQFAVDVLVQVDSYTLAVGPGQPHAAGSITFVVASPSSFVQDGVELLHENDKQAGLKLMKMNKSFDDKKKSMRTYTAPLRSTKDRSTTGICIADQTTC